MKVNYANTIIYKLVCNDPKIKDLYIGHTTNYKQRNIKHKSCCSNIKSKEYNLKVYKFIRDNGGYENWRMIIIKNYPCNNKREAEEEEHKNIIEYNSNLNSQSGYLTEEDIKAYNKNYDKIRYENNKEKILEKHREKITCDICGSIIRRDSLARHKRTSKCKNYKLNN